jgi:hypothetical protein
MSAVLFDEKDPSEKDVLTFDFTDRLGAGETVSGATVAIVLKSGTDGSPASILDGAAQVQSPQVLQRVKDGVSGCTYEISCLVDTNLGNKRIAAIILPVLAVQFQRVVPQQR